MDVKEKPPQTSREGRSRATRRQGTKRRSYPRPRQLRNPRGRGGSGDEAPGATNSPSGVWIEPDPNQKGRYSRQNCHDQVIIVANRTCPHLHAAILTRTVAIFRT